MSEFFLLIKSYPKGRGNCSMFSLDKSDESLIENYMVTKKTESTHTQVRKEVA